MRSLIIVGLLAVSAVVIMAKPASEVASDNPALRAVSEGSGQFAGNFFKTVAKIDPKKNLITSPLSASIVLAMTQYGARKNTQKEMLSTLHMPEDGQLSRTGYQNLIDSLNNVENVTLKVANKIFLQKNFQVKPEFTAITSDNFRSKAEQVDFAKAVEAVGIINNWADAQTNHKIKKILNDDDVSADTRLVLCNALYFKGNWAEKFKAENTKDRDFHVDAQTVKKVPMMFKRSQLHYGELPELKAKFVELPYQNKDLSMMIILPDAVDGLPALVEGLANVKIGDIRNKGYSREVELHLPKFKIESTLPLNEPLKQMGMAEMFTDNADFSGIADVPLKVGKVIQKAFIEVNEEGSEAAAVTAVDFVLTSYIEPTPPVNFIVDRPFAYGIISTAANLENSLFVGTVVNPLL